MSPQTGPETMNFEMFQYKPLDNPAEQIRLLEVHAGALDSPVICELKTYSRSAAPQYYAISYTWGESWPRTAIFVNGQIAMVRLHCLYAIAQVRLHLEKDCFVWIDAICIDQQNLHEKSCQVMAMGEIFESALCVFACIGSMTKSAAYMFDTAEEISHQDCNDSDACYFCSRNANNEVSGLDKYQFHLLHTWLNTIDQPIVDELVKAFEDFGNNEYWRRLWVVQEISLAAEVRILCGQREIILSALVLIQKLFKEIIRGSSTALSAIASGKGIDHRAKVDGTSENAFSMMCDYQWWGADLDLGDHLHHLDEWKCNDARDRIFGLLRLIKWPEDCGPPTPDYSMQPIDLTVDVLKRLGRDWKFLDQVEWLLEAIGVDLGDTATQRSTRRSARLMDTGNTDAFAGVAYSDCTCDHPLMPHIAMQLNTHRCAMIYLGTSGNLHATIRSEANIHQHVELELYNEEGSGFTIAKPTEFSEVSGVIIMFTSTVRAGDLLLEFEESPNPWNFGGRFNDPRFCLILRQAKQDIFEIIGHAEVYGRSRLCVDEPRCPCLKDTYSAREAIYKRFTVNLDAEDAVAYVLSGREDRGNERLRNGGTLDSEPLRYINRRFGRSKFSSFAFRSYSTFELNEPEPSLFNGVPAVGHRSTVCAECGGLFVPDKS